MTCRLATIGRPGPEARRVTGQVGLAHLGGHRIVRLDRGHPLVELELGLGVGLRTWAKTRPAPPGAPQGIPQGRGWSCRPPPIAPGDDGSHRILGGDDLQAVELELGVDAPAIVCRQRGELDGIKRQLGGGDHGATARISGSDRPGGSSSPGPARVGAVVRREPCRRTGLRRGVRRWPAAHSGRRLRAM